MKKIRDSDHPTRWGCIWVPDRVKAVIDMLGTGRIDTYATVGGAAGYYYYCDIYKEDGSTLLVMNQYRTRGEVARLLTKWVDAGCPESEDTFE